LIDNYSGLSSLWQIGPVKLSINRRLVMLVIMTVEEFRDLVMGVLSTAITDEETEKRAKEIVVECIKMARDCGYVKGTVK
jgi:hypothetical protein